MSVHLLSARYSIARFVRPTHNALEYSPSGTSLHEYMAAILQRGCLPKRRLLPPFSNHRFSKILLPWTLEKRCHGVHKLFTNTTEMISDRVSSLTKRTLTMCRRATTFVCFEKKEQYL